jgi:CMP-N-acetylneuraminic acid synthetase
MKINFLILAKSQSKRLENKNTLPFNGKPMFLTNVEKCLKLGDTYVSSDSLDILKQAEVVGAKGILRPESLCGDIPNIPVYKHALENMEDCVVLIAVQANSPTIKEEVIQEVITCMEIYDEVMTCHTDGTVYGSVWAILKDKLLSYGDPYKPTPRMMIVDDSIDIHTQQDYNWALSTVSTDKL